MEAYSLNPYMGQFIENVTYSSNSTKQTFLMVASYFHDDCHLKIRPAEFYRAV